MLYSEIDAIVLFLDIKVLTCDFLSLLLLFNTVTICRKKNMNNLFWNFVSSYFKFTLK